MTDYQGPFFVDSCAGERMVCDSRHANVALEDVAAMLNALYALKARTCESCARHHPRSGDVPRCSILSALDREDLVNEDSDRPMFLGKPFGCSAHAPKEAR